MSPKEEEEAERHPTATGEHSQTTIRLWQQRTQHVTQGTRSCVVNACAVTDIWVRTLTLVTKLTEHNCFVAQ
jgi:hypothetical protein